MDNPMGKRHHRRMNRDTMVTLGSLQTGVNEDTRMVNCSDNGLYFESDQFFQPGSEVFVEIENYFHDQTEPYICHHAKIIWGRKLKEATYAFGYGAQYVRLPNEQNSPETDSDQIKDLRKHPRKYIAKRVIFRIGKKYCEGFISDISRNGCFIENSEFLNVGQILGLAIPGTKFVGNNILTVEVVRLSPTGVGVIFKRTTKQRPKK